MTGNDLYEVAKRLIYEKLGEAYYPKYSLVYINLLLAENFDLNNSIREWNEDDALENMVQLDALTDEIKGFVPQMMYEILPLGLAKYFFIDDDLKRFNIFDTLYFNAQQKYTKAVPYSMTDVYLDGDA